MAGKISVENVNRNFPKYPVTVEDKGWIYGVWYCGTSYQKIKLHGQYPPTFLNRALALFPDATSILHAPSGTLAGIPGITLDIKHDEVRKPDVISDCKNLPFSNDFFDLILSDPPYTKKDSKIYGCEPFPMGRFMNECHRTLKVGGHVGMLHTYYPMYHRKMFKLVALIGVVTGFSRATRMFSVFEKKATNGG